MITLQAVILQQHLRKDGSCPVKIRITHKRKVAYFSTNLLADKSEISRDKKIRPGTLTDMRARDCIVEIREKLNNLSLSEAESMDVKELVAYVKLKFQEDKPFKLDFLEYMRKKAAEKPEGTAATYYSAARALERHISSNTIDISAISVKFLRNFEEFLKNEPNPKGTDSKSTRKVSQYLACVRHIHNLAREEFNEPDTGIIRIPYSPFDYYKVPAQNPSHHRNKSVELIQKMINSRASLSGREKTGVDLFLLSFMLMGANVPDIFSAGPIKKRVLEYHRQKTRDRRSDNAEQRIKIESFMNPLIEEYADKEGKRAFNFYHNYSLYNNLTRAANLGLKSWAESIGEEPFTMYSARHSFASIGRSSLCRLDKSVIDDCLVHVDQATRVVDIYAEKDWQLLWDASAKIMSLFDWSKL